MQSALFFLVILTARGFALDGPDPAGAGMDPARLDAIRARMQQYVDQGAGAGYVTLVARHGVIAHVAATGWQDREKKVAMRADTLFQIKSMTKPVTAAGVMMLVDEGRISLNDAVEKYLPEFRGQTLAGGAKPAHPITLYDLLTHTSGMAASFHQPNTDGRRSLAEMVASEARFPLEFEPGSKWQYCNTGIATLGRIIEVVSAGKYEEFIAARIFAPLGMKDSSFFPPAAQRHRIAAVYTEEQGRLKPADVDLYRQGWIFPAPEGGMFSTAADMANFYQMMLNRGRFSGRRILSAAAVETMTMVHTGDLKAGFAPGVGYGLGWAVVKDAHGTFRYNSIGTFSHGGAYRTYGYVDPAKDLIGVIMLQRTNGGGDVADEINSFIAMAAAAVER